MSQLSIAVVNSPHMPGMGMAWDMELAIDIAVSCQIQSLSRCPISLGIRSIQ
jgi:hypothetical protein